MHNVKQIQVAVGVVYRNEAFYLTKRPQEVHQGGKWEFPGGKVEADETIAQALLRELHEEIAIDILACQPLISVEHDYGDKQVCLEVFLVDQFVGEPNAQEGQQESWFSLAELSEIDLPAANLAIVEKLTTLFGEQS